MDWEKIRQLINPLIEDLDLLLQRKENDRSFLMLLQDVLSKYVEISQILQSWDQQTITENLLAGQAAFNEILNGMEQNAPVFQIQEGIYAFGQTLVELEFDTKATVVYTDKGEEKRFEAVGNGPIDAVKRGLQETLGINVKILDYEEHALQSGSNSQAAAYIHLLDAESGSVTYGVGVSSNITRASVRAIFSAVNRLGLGEHN